MAASEKEENLDSSNFFLSEKHCEAKGRNPTCPVHLCSCIPQLLVQVPERISRCRLLPPSTQVLSSRVTHPCTAHTTCACGGSLKSHSNVQGTQESFAPLLFQIVRPVAFSGLEIFCRTPHHVHYPKSGRKLNKTTQQPFCLHGFTAEWLKEPHLFALTFFSAYCVMKTYELIGTYREMWQTLYIYLGSEIIRTLDSLSLRIWIFFLIATATC